LLKTNTGEGDLEIGFGGAAGIEGRGECPRNSPGVQTVAEPMSVAGLAAAPAAGWEMRHWNAGSYV
jgi:hypothetical protein